ncbi:Retrovirus-related Pol polyprotein from transposon RE1 [Araneus ventricosus]|uniref:Retrovirus-related Pol polyprotein from transposon RE1 n=1 Tax=Araneus ventricosus TaxID=182803 RepID=A0A4Y2HSA4_ARAVE|nr:Retrovirus-related Pol polyprotein from transposon RE1 [Araneus ventricosus]
MEDEIKSLNKHKIWELVDKHDNTKIVKSKWVYTIKDSKTPKFKARLVATGFNQVKNVDYLESYSPVVNIDTFRLLIALAAKLNLAVNFFDVKTAYLHSDLEEEVYMTTPPGYEMETEGKVYRLKKSIYGLPQSGRNWYFKLKSELERIGLKEIASDNCVFVMINKNEVLVLCIYVDVIALFSNDIVLSNNVIRKLKTIFELKETTDGEKFLGIEVRRNENGFSLSQVEYINFLLEKYNMSLCNSVKTPMSKNEDKFFDSGNKFVNVTEFQTLIGELLYLANRTRPDISFTVTYLSQFCQKPEQKHLKLAKKILRHLKGTKEKTPVYSNKVGCINASSDASWGNAENGKSFSGSVLMLGDSLVAWKCNKQRSVCLSTCEAELCALSETAKNVLWAKNVLNELNCFSFIESCVIYSDSKSAIDWLNCARSSSKTRHVNLRFHFVKDLISGGEMQIIFVPTEEMISDFLTKTVTHENYFFVIKLDCCNKLVSFAGGGGCWMQALANDSSLCRFSIADWRCHFARLYLTLFLCETLCSSSVCVLVCVSACVVHLIHLIHVFNKEMFMNWTCIQFPRLQKPLYYNLKLKP